MPAGSMFPSRTLVNTQKSVLNGYKPLVVLSAKTRYTGRWKDNEHYEFGKWSHAGTRIYEGCFKNGKRDGHGTLRMQKLAGGCIDVVYEGEWKKDRMHGDGKRVYNNGIYQGKWENGQRSGIGIMWYDEKDSSYMGEWKNDKYHGIGVLVVVNGNRYEGSFANGKKHGEGNFYHLHTGQLQKGIWVEDSCVTSMMCDEFRNQVLRPTPYPITQTQLFSPDNLVRKVFREHLDAIRGVVPEKIRKYIYSNTAP